MGETRLLTATEKEQIMGFPAGHTNLKQCIRNKTFVISESKRKKLIGNSFSVPAVVHLLTPLAKHLRKPEMIPLDLLEVDSKALVLQINRTVDFAQQVDD